MGKGFQWPYRYVEIPDGIQQLIFFRSMVFCISWAMAIQALHFPEFFFSFSAMSFSVLRFMAVDQIINGPHVFVTDFGCLVTVIIPEMQLR